MENTFLQNTDIKKTIVVAHRGGSLLAPENTIAAFKNALELGVERIELDVQLSKDNAVVVIHDEKLDRTTNGIGEVSAYAYSQLSGFNAGSKFSEHFKGETIPLLENLLELVSGKATLLIEIKKVGHRNKGIENAVVELIHKHQAASWCVVQSFCYDSIVKIHELDETIKTGLLFTKPPIDKILNNKIDVRFISEINFHHAYASKKNIEHLHSLNKKVFVWTVNKPERMKQLVENGVDGIITDDPKTLKALLSN